MKQEVRAMIMQRYRAAFAVVTLLASQWYWNLPDSLPHSAVQRSHGGTSKTCLFSLAFLCKQRMHWLEIHPTLLVNAKSLPQCHCQQRWGITCSSFHNTALTKFSTALKADRHVAFFLTTHTVVLHLMKGVQAEEQQEAAGGEEEGSDSDEEDKQEGRGSDEEAGHAGATQADVVPESPGPSKQSEVLPSPAPSKRRSKPASPGQASPQSIVSLTSKKFYQQAKSIFHLVSW